MAKSTSCEIINDVCQAIVTWPTGNALRAVVDGFASEWNFPQCAGAIDGTHIPITAPPDNPAYYCNRKRFYQSFCKLLLTIHTGMHTVYHYRILHCFRCIRCEIKNSLIQN